MDNQTKELIDFIAAKIEEISEKFGILLDIKTLEPEKPKKGTKERNQHLQKDKKSKEICRLFKKRVSPFIDLHLGKNATYKKNVFIDLMIHLGVHQDFAEDGSKMFKLDNGICPNADTLLYHLKKYNDIRELQRMYNTPSEIIWEMARKANIFNIKKRFDVAIDYTEWFYYGNRKAKMVVAKKPEKGTASCYKFATINIVEGGKRFTLYAVPVSGIDNKESVLTQLISYAKNRIKINRIYLDRGFFDSVSINTLNKLHQKFLMPAIRSYYVKRVMELSPAPSVVKGFTIRNVRLNLVIVNDKNGEKRVFATNEEFDENDVGFANRLFMLYSKRWGIETSFRVIKHSFMPKTTSKNYIIRLFYFLFSVLLYNLWILADVFLCLSLAGMVMKTHIMTAQKFGKLLLIIDPGG